MLQGGDWILNSRPKGVLLEIRDGIERTLGADFVSTPAQYGYLALSTGIKNG